MGSNPVFIRLCYDQAVNNNGIKCDFYDDQVRLPNGKCHVDVYAINLGEVDDKKCSTTYPMIINVKRSPQKVYEVSCKSAPKPPEFFFQAISTRISTRDDLLEKRSKSIPKNESEFYRDWLFPQAQFPELSSNTIHKAKRRHAKKKASTTNGTIKELL